MTEAGSCARGPCEGRVCGTDAKSRRHSPPPQQQHATARRHLLMALDAHTAPPGAREGRVRGSDASPGAHLYSDTQPPIATWSLATLTPRTPRSSRSSGRM